ncbi:MAG TPA: two-component sensor histidine kinase, partial [Desulfobacteraceae bacterium]|nr:two-component sensor histidine kinase [Desulfobacteraceae bacterium]
MTKQNHYKSVREIILLSMILAPLIPFIIIFGIGYYYFTTSLETGTVASLKRIVEDHRQMIDFFLTERKSDLDFVIHAYKFEDLSHTDKLNEVFDFLQKKSNAFVDLGVFDEEGNHVAYHGPYKLRSKVYKDADWFKNVMQKGFYISDIFLGFRQVPHFVIAVEREENGKKWVIRATIDSFVFNDLVKKVRIGKTGEAYILNTEGVLQTDRRSGGNLMAKPSENLSIPESKLDIQTFTQKNERSETFFYATTWLKNKDWLLVVRLEEVDAFSYLHTAFYLIIMTVIIGGMAIIVLAVYLTNHILRHLTETDAEKEQLNQQLIRASRLAELGEMAAGFAHEINNPLQIIRTEQSLIEMIFSEMKDNGEFKPSESLAELQDSMDQIKLQIERCAGITQAILKFGRQSEPVFKHVDLRRFIPEIIRMIEKKASVQGIEIEQELEGDTPSVHGDAGQLQQVMLNLLNNAMDAITEKHGSQGGRLLIITGRDEEDRFAVIMVQDNGSGITPDNLKKIFSPFFTTKPVGRGTGLGLSVCYGIINHMGGTMQV